MYGCRSSAQQSGLAGFSFCPQSESVPRVQHGYFSVVRVLHNKSIDDHIVATT